ncbi:MAG: UDP-N-acetylmuramoyl-tripeptide--D-alanyl-D-alanine ligase [Cyanobacteria bacterium RYN_339]|nr:UDP-N-acetylmuramoyl-tripeptide--D-alanyl-D-alanine ligase [Cyanobacteria bacterium RYN_339]
MFSLTDLLESTGGALAGDAHDLPELAAVTTDSRHVPPDAVFVCLRGESHDGHKYAAAAVAAGARVVVAARDALLDPVPGAPVILVPDTLIAYGQLARAWRRKLGTKLVAITGSSGKTSTKEATAAFLSIFGATLRTEANYNNEIGVPLTLLGLSPEHAYGVVEMGMRGPGEIGYLTDVAEPDVGVITNIGTAHIGRLGSREAIARAKAELWHHLPAGKTAVVPFDDEWAARMAGEWGGRCVSWSLDHPAATVWAADVQAKGDGQTFTVYWKRGNGLAMGRASVELPSWGDHHRANALTAIATGWALGLTPPKHFAIKPASLAGRERTFTVGGVTIVDDSYNANPQSMMAALEAFASAPGDGRRYVALGDMAELGELAEDAHEEVGDYAGKQDFAGMVAVGEFASAYARGCPRLVPISDQAAACNYLVEHLRPGDRVLLKASRAAKFEGLAACLEGKLGGKA